MTHRMILDWLDHSIEPAAWPGDLIVYEALARFPERLDYCKAMLACVKRDAGKLVEFVKFSEALIPAGIAKSFLSSKTILRVGIMQLIA